MNAECDLLKKSVSSIMSRSPVCVEMQDTMETVNAVLHQHGLTSVPVIDPEKQDCFGIVSLKDISGLKARKVGLQTIRAWEACTYKPITVPPDTAIEDVLNLMVSNRIHQVIVVEKGKPIGLVSTFDVIAACMARQKNACAICESVKKEPTLQAAANFS